MGSRPAGENVIMTLRIDFTGTMLPSKYTLIYQVTK
jgi:hypothetical protein